MVLKHGNPQRQAPYRSKEDTLKLEEFTRKFQQEPDDVVTFGEYFRVDSKKEVNFLDHLEQYDASEENLNLTDNRILIQNIVLMSKQELKYRVWLFGSKNFYNDNENLTKAVDFIDFDLPTYGKKYKNTGLYIYIISDLNLLYNDLDQTNKLHVAIENLSTAPKLYKSELIFQCAYESLETKKYNKV